MFRKIRSERAPEKTVWTDIKDGLAPHLERIFSFLCSLFQRFPKSVYFLMILAIAYSLLFSFRKGNRSAHPEEAKGSANNRGIVAGKSFADGLNAISSTANSLRNTISIRQSIDSVLRKKTLSLRDSFFLDSALRILKQNRLP